MHLYVACKISKRAASPLRSRVDIEDETSIMISLINLLQIENEKGIQHNHKQRQTYANEIYIASSILE